MNTGDPTHLREKIRNNAKEMDSLLVRFNNAMSVGNAKSAKEILDQIKEYSKEISDNVEKLKQTYGL